MPISNLMNDRFPAIAIFTTATTFAGFALWLGLRPDALLNAFSIESSTPQMLTEIRAFYGGIQLAIALVMIVLWWRGELFASLLVGGLPLLGSASGRLIGIVIDGYSSTHVGFAVFELVGVVFCLAGCWIVSRRRLDT